MRWPIKYFGCKGTTGSNVSEWANEVSINTPRAEGCAGVRRRISKGRLKKWCAPKLATLLGQGGRTLLAVFVILKLLPKTFMNRRHACWREWFYDGWDLTRNQRSEICSRERTAARIPVLPFSPIHRFVQPESYIFSSCQKPFLDQSIQKRFYLILKSEALAAT